MESYQSSCEKPQLISRLLIKLSHQVRHAIHYVTLIRDQGGRSAPSRYHLWATRYHSAEFYAAGLFPTQAKGDSDGIAFYSEKHKDESLVECDLVTWYTFGCTHVVRAEDWPVMPVEKVGFRLQPFGFFSNSPAIDVPPPTKKKCDANLCEHY